MEFEFTFEAQTLEATESRNIWGNTWVRVSQCQYPEASWNDMPVALLSYLLSVLSEIGRDGESVKEVWFYDGPFAVRFELVKDNLLKISVVPEGSEVVVTMDLNVLLEDLAIKKDQLIAACVARGWADYPDVLRLRSQAGS